MLVLVLVLVVVCSGQNNPGLIESGERSGEGIGIRSESDRPREGTSARQQEGRKGQHHTEPGTGLVAGTGKNWRRCTAKKGGVYIPSWAVPRYTTHPKYDAVGSAIAQLAPPLAGRPKRARVCVVRQIK